MSEMMILLKPNDSMGKKEYNGYASLREAVDRNISYFHQAVVETTSGRRLNFDMICNDEFLISEDEQFQKVNAFASMMSGQEIRGTVAILVDCGDGENRGFYDSSVYSECEDAMKVFQHFFESHREEIQKLHKKFDGNKSEPRFEIHPFGT